MYRYAYSVDSTSVEPLWASSLNSAGRRLPKAQDKSILPLCRPDPKLVTRAHCSSIPELAQARVSDRSGEERAQRVAYFFFF